MEVSWSIPFVHFLLLGAEQREPARGFGAPAGAPFLLLAFFWAVFVLYMQAGDWLNRSDVPSPRRELLALLFVLLSTLAGEAALVYAGSGFRPGVLLSDFFGALFNFAEGVRSPLLFLGYNLFLWWRVAAATSRDLGFFAVGVSFRLSMLFALLGNGLLALSARTPTSAALLYLWIFFAFGLVSTALARIDDKSFLADHSPGALLPWSRFLQLLAATAAVLGLSALASAFWSPAGFARVGEFLAPLTRPLGWIVRLLLAGLIWLLTPLFNMVERFLRSLSAQQLEMPPAEVPPPPLFSEDLYSVADLVNQWALLRYCLVIGGVLLGIALIWLFFTRTTTPQRSDQAEETAPEPPLLGRTAGGHNRLRGLWSLLRRTGLGRGLLAAVSVQNFYANLARIARRRGFARAPAQPPDLYLPMLSRAFPGQQAALERLTAAYMRVHYGDARVSSAELADLRRDYDAVRATPPPEARTVTA